METAEIIRYSVLSVSLNDILGEFPVEFDGERQDPLRSEMDLYILSDRACDDGKHDAAECYDGNRASVERHILEDEEDDRHKDSDLRKPCGDQGPAQLVHPPEDLERQLLDSRKHEARGKDESERQSSDQIRIRSICREQIRDHDSDEIHYGHDDQSRTDEFPIFGFQFGVIRILIRFFDGSQAFDGQNIES